MNAQEAARILAKDNDSVVVVGITREASGDLISDECFLNLDEFHAAVVCARTKMFENQTLNKNRVLPSAMILDRLSIECIAKAATKEKIIESCCISSTKLVEQLVKSEPQYSKIVEKMADVYISLSQLLIALPIRDDDLNAAIKRKITRKLKHNPTLIK